MFPDLELAVEEGEPVLASHLFEMVKTWVVELRELVNTTQAANQASMAQIQTIVEQSALGLDNVSKFMSVTDGASVIMGENADSKMARTYLYQLSAHVADTLQKIKVSVQENNSSEEDLTTENILELFFQLFSNRSPSSLTSSAANNISLSHSSNSNDMPIVTTNNIVSDVSSLLPPNSSDYCNDFNDNSNILQSSSASSIQSNNTSLAIDSRYMQLTTHTGIPPGSPTSSKNHLSDALDQLRQVIV
jgi:hypothetical protein